MPHPGAKPAVQHRSKDTRDRLLGAMDALLREKPFEAITITELAARAATSPASIYQRFTNKDAAVAILIELYLRTVQEWSLSRDGRIDVESAGTLRDALVMVGRVACRQIEALGYVMRPAYLHSRLRPDLLGETWSVLERQAAEGFGRLLARFPAETGARDSVQAAAMIAYFYNMMVLGRLLHAAPTKRGRGGAPGGTPLGDAEGFAEELADFVCGYLAAPPRTPAPRSPAPRSSGKRARSS